jgi:hypothetical protein
MEYPSGTKNVANPWAKMFRLRAYIMTYPTAANGELKLRAATNNRRRHVPNAKKKIAEKI